MKQYLGVFVVAPKKHIFRALQFAAAKTGCSVATQDYSVNLLFQCEILPWQANEGLDAIWAS